MVQPVALPDTGVSLGVLAALLLLQLSANVPGKTAQVLGPLPAKWETWMDFLAPDLSLAQTRLLYPFGE